MKNKKYLLTFLVLLISGLFIFAFSKPNTFDITINGESFVIPQEMGQVQLKNKTTMVPLRAFTEKLGWDIEWNQITKTITIPYKSGNIVMKVGEDTYTNEKNEIVNLIVAPYISDERVYLPLRALTEALGYSLEYDNSSNVHKIAINKLKSDTTYTIMLYINASDLESEGSAATSTINEIINSNTDENINILVQTGGSTSWGKPEISNKSNQIHLINNGEFTTVSDLGSKNMGESSTLSEFIDYSIANYSADKYALILWSHGFGPIGGIGYDSLFNNDGLTLPELKIALDNKPIKYEFIGFDSCLMGSIEMATLLKDYTDYFLASEDLVMSGSWDYKTWLTKLSEDIDINTKDLGKIIADSYQSKYNYSEPVLCLTDLTKIDEVNKQISNLSQELIELLKRWPFEDIYNARYNTSGFGDTGLEDGPVDMVDIIELSRMIDKHIYEHHNTETVTNALKNAIYPISPYTDQPTNGLSIYFPFKNTFDIEQKLDLYKQINFNSDYIEFLDLYVDKLIEYKNQFIN